MICRENNYCGPAYSYFQSNFWVQILATGLHETADGLGHHQEGLPSWSQFMRSAYPKSGRDRFYGTHVIDKAILLLQSTQAVLKGIKTDLGDEREKRMEGGQS